MLTADQLANLDKFEAMIRARLLLVEHELRRREEDIESLLPVLEKREAIDFMLTMPGERNLMFLCVERQILENRLDLIERCRAADAQET